MPMGFFPAGTYHKFVGPQMFAPKLNHYPNEIIPSPFLLIFRCLKIFYEKF